MRDPRDIITALAAFDGTRTAPLKTLLADDFSADAEAALMAEIPSPHEVAATWVVKALVEAKRLGVGQLAVLFEQIPDLTEPDAALHLLQCAQYVSDAAPILRPHLSAFYGHPKILLRVWAFDAYCRGAPETEDLSERIRQGLTSRSAAMRARARSLAKAFDIDLENGV
ncbi:hypothetical protein V8J82_06320 [Gymnodinialimonas sp. 2305UL16-5]|uniref:hypothetical protein n=1 Tax=Gymnodinialimonas mytili TaxID=3126503 RepID=UPI003094BE33